MNYRQQLYYNVLWLQILLGEEEEEEEENSSEEEDNTVLQMVLIRRLNTRYIKPRIYCVASSFLEGFSPLLLVLADAKVSSTSDCEVREGTKEEVDAGTKREVKVGTKVGAKVRVEEVEVAIAR